MSREQNVIRMISGIMPKSQLQHNKIFESDAEIISVTEGKILVNIDEFSSEDLFGEHDAYTLGWNIAVGAVSDILATGGRPVFFGHSLVIDDKWSDSYIKRFSKGISDVLHRTGTAFIGGDYGSSGNWRCTATAIGRLEGVPLLRCNAVPGDAIYITGEIGAGNLDACMRIYAGKSAMGLLKNEFSSKFVLRHEEAAIIRQFSTCCTDTSDGLFNALTNISEMSNTGYIVENLPYFSQGIVISELLSMPHTLLFIGECGEYELMFTVSKEKEAAFLRNAAEHHMKFFKIGTVTDNGTKTLIEEKGTYNLSQVYISARDYEDKRKYIAALTEILEKSLSPHDRS